jgi:glycosyltransferase involved in cell wall biosynthesis
MASYPDVEAYVEFSGSSIMRIAYVIPGCAYPQLPTFIVNEMIAVQEAGHDIVLMPLYPDPPAQVCHGTFERLKPIAVVPAALLDVKIVCLALWTLFTRPWRVLKALIPLHWAAGLNPYAHAALLTITPKALAAAWRLRRLQVSHIHAHFARHTTTYAGVAAVVGGIPYSFTAHAYDIYCTTPKLRNDTLGWKLHHAQQVIAISQYGAEFLRQRLSIANRDRVHTVYVGVPMNLFHEEPPPCRDADLHLLCIARLEEKKGLDTLIAACAIIRRSIPFHLRLYGEGPLREVLRAQIARLELSNQITLHGAITQEEVARQMKACHIFVMPCRQDWTGDMDGIPTVFMEAMASGRPVISCPISGIPELVRDGETGLLVSPDDPTALAAAVIKLANDDALRSQLGRQARALVTIQHDQHRNARRLTEILTAAPRSVSGT